MAFSLLFRTSVRRKRLLSSGKDVGFLTRPVYVSFRRYLLASSHHFDPLPIWKSVAVYVLDAAGALGNMHPVCDQRVRTVPFPMWLQLDLDGSGSVDRLLVCIPLSFALLDLCHGFRFELEPIFLYRLHVFIRSRYMGLSVFEYTKRIIHMCTALLRVPCDEYRLWYVPPDVIYIAHQPRMVLELPLGSRVTV